MKKKAFLCMLSLLCFLVPLPAQTVSSSSSSTSSSSTAIQPEPYDLTKIPPGVLDLRRFEIIMFGAIPVAYLFSEIITSTALYAKYKTPEYIPLVGTGEVKNNEKMYTVGVTFSLAFLVATIDMILYNKKRQETEAGEEKRLRVRKADELFGGPDENFMPQSADSLAGETDPSSPETAESVTEETIP